MPLSNYALDHFVSQEMSKLSQCKAPEVTSGFPKSKSWVSAFILNSIFRFQPTPETKRFAFVFLRRAEAAFVEYDHARAALSEYVEAAQEKKPSLYFRALHHFEMTIAMLYQAYTFGRRAIQKDLYEKGDNSSLDRLNSIYNKSRHFDPGNLPSGHLHAVWITDDGIHIADCSVSFNEFGELLEEIGRIADSISNGPNT